MITVGQFFSALQNVAEEKIFSMYNINPLQATGIEGAAGLSCLLILLPIFNFCTCTPLNDSHGNPLLCPFGVIEDSVYAMQQIVHDRNLSLYVVGYSISTVFFNSIGISIVKYTSSMSRTVISCLRIFMVWLLSLLIGWERFIWLQVFKGG